MADDNQNAICVIDNPFKSKRFMKFCKICICSLITAIASAGIILEYVYGTISELVFPKTFEPTSTVVMAPPITPPTAYEIAKPFINDMQDLIDQAEEQHILHDYNSSANLYVQAMAIFEDEVDENLKEKVSKLERLYLTALKGAGYNANLFGDNQKSFAIYSKGISLKPNDCVILVGLGNAYHHGVIFGNAKQYYGKADQNCPRDFNAKLGLLKVAIWENNEKEQELQIQRIFNDVEQLPTGIKNEENEKQMVRIMYAFEEMKRDSEKILWANKILDLYPDNENAQLVLHTEGILLIQ